MQNITNILLELLTLEGPNTEKLRVTPCTTLHIDKLLLSSCKDSLVEACKKIPKDDLVGCHMMKRHTEQSIFLAKMLFALGDKLGVWQRFPMIESPWNLPHYPCAHTQD